MAQASLVQDLWLGFEPRLRARRLAPWEPADTRLLFQLDPAQSLDDPAVERLLESFSERLDVVAWQPRRTANGSAPAEVLADTRRLAADGGAAFGRRRLLLGGWGLGAWLALAAADCDGLVGAIALAPSLCAAGPTAPEPSELRSALAAALTAQPPAIPYLVAEGVERPGAEARVVGEWRGRVPSATSLVVPGSDESLVSPAAVAAITGWAQAAGRP